VFIRFFFSPLALVPSKSNLLLLISAWLINDNDDPSGIGINKLDESVIYSTKSEFKIIGSSESKSS
jgi:hypothetical protein